MGEDGDVFHCPQFGVDLGLIWENVKTSGSELIVSVHSSRRK